MRFPKPPFFVVCAPPRGFRQSRLGNSCKGLCCLKCQAVAFPRDQPPLAPPFLGKCRAVTRCEWWGASIGDCVRTLPNAINAERTGYEKQNLFYTHPYKLRE